MITNRHSNRSATNKLLCFLALPFDSSFGAIREVIRAGVEEAGYKIVTLDRDSYRIGSSIQETLLNGIAQADCLIADISDRNQNVFYELGLAQAMGKGILIIAEEFSLNRIPFDIRGNRVISYTKEPSGLAKLQKNISRSLYEFRRFPRQRILGSNLQLTPPFVLDWDKLSDPDIENLCKELLAQLGFRRVDWNSNIPGVDLIAELPKKDPDGYTYQELWLVSLGLRDTLHESRGFFELFMRDKDRIIDRLMRSSRYSSEKMAQTISNGITLLLVFPRKSDEERKIERQLELYFEGDLEGRHERSKTRVRVWDHDYLTSMVQRFPNIGYKYFSDEGRIRSVTRKSYEDLYHENSGLSERLVQLVRELEDEKNKRIRAERDSVWKDISFSAAHKIGNPIFAIETDLNPLLKRIRGGQTAEALDVIENMRSALEKAKATIEQFKSLARAQEIKPVPTLIAPLLQDSCSLVSNLGVECIIDCPPGIIINGDPERLKECFDELVVNSTHWFDKATKTIEISVSIPENNVIPEELDTAQKYVLLHFKDNGCGIPISDKTHVFDAFFTKRHHGTGLGLALVRRIIEGHGGNIIESGVPGKGADFELYLPLDNKGSKRKSSKKIVN